jgi:formate dehydrogenase maturation protein FdhE
MKRWERLVHLELADLSSTDCEQEWKGVREKCIDCGSVHKEIFPIMRSGREGDEYAKVVEVIGRWAAFVNIICSDAS